MAMTFDERLEMLQRASRGWLELKRLVDRIPDRDMNRSDTVGVWSGRDLLAHIANWEEVALGVIERLESGEPAGWPGGETDEKNAALLEPYRDASLEDVRDYLETSHFSLMDAAEHARNITPDVLLSVTANHYAKHMDDFRSIAGTRG
jgi:hypothetical protein